MALLCLKRGEGGSAEGKGGPQPAVRCWGYAVLAVHTGVLTASHGRA